eukprot:g2261.t1
MENEKDIPDLERKKKTKNDINIVTTSNGVKDSDRWRSSLANIRSDLDSAKARETEISAQLQRFYDKQVLLKHAQGVLLRVLESEGFSHLSSTSNSVYAKKLVDSESALEETKLLNHHLQERLKKVEDERNVLQANELKLQKTVQDLQKQNAEYLKEIQSLRQKTFSSEMEIQKLIRISQGGILSHRKREERQRQQ